MRVDRNLSLRRQLLVWLLVPQTLLWMAAAAVTYQVAVRHANLAIDKSLAESSRALARQIRPLGDGLFIDFPKAAREILEADVNDRLHYMVSSPPGQFLLGDSGLPLPPSDAPHIVNSPIFYDGRLGREIVRVAAIYVPVGTAERPQIMLVQVAKSTAVRTEIASEILWDTVLPLALLMLATSIVVWAGIARGLLPLRILRRLVENRSSRDLAPIELKNAPAEVKDLVRALNILLGEVERQVEGQRRFIADAAHQLRTPLAGLKSQTEVARRELDQAQPDLDLVRQRMDRIELGADRGIRLVNQLLALARAEPDAAVVMNKMELHRLLQELGREFAPNAVQKGLDFSVEGLDVPISIIGNEGLLRELFANLLSNAVAYTPAGGEITLSLRHNDNSIEVLVSDTGPGIPQNEHEAVFERFYRRTLHTNELGCGLGLPIAREIARRHNASIELLQQNPHGLIVRTSFPFPS